MLRQFQFLANNPLFLQIIFILYLLIFLEYVIFYSEHIILLFIRIF